MTLTSISEHAHPRTQRLREFLHSFALHWCVNTLTRVTATTDAAIDNSITIILVSEVFVIDTDIPDHFGQELIISGAQTRLPHKVYSKGYGA